MSAVFAYRVMDNAAVFLSVDRKPIIVVLRDGVV